MLLTGCRGQWPSRIQLLARSVNGADCCCITLIAVVDIGIKSVGAIELEKQAITLQCNQPASVSVNPK